MAIKHFQISKVTRCAGLSLQHSICTYTFMIKPKFKYVSLNFHPFLVIISIPNIELCSSDKETQKIENSSIENHFPNTKIVEAFYNFNETNHWYDPVQVYRHTNLGQGDRKFEKQVLQTACNCFYRNNKLLFVSASGFSVAGLDRQWTKVYGLYKLSLTDLCVIQSKCKGPISLRPQALNPRCKRFALKLWLSHLSTYTGLCNISFPAKGQELDFITPGENERTFIV